MTEDTKSDLFDTKEPALISFPNLLEAKRVSKSAAEKPKFSINVEFDDDSTDLSRLKSEIGRVAKAKWPGLNVGEAIRDGSLVVPITAGDKLVAKAEAKGKKREWSKGKQVLTARSEFDPTLASVIGGKYVEYEGANRATFKPFEYTGVKALVQVNLVAYDAVGESGKPGVTAYLNMVCVTEKGPKLAGGGQSASEVFKGYIGTTSQEDPTGGEAAAGGDAW